MSILESELAEDREGVPYGLCSECDAVLDDMGYEGLFVCPSCGRIYRKSQNEEGDE